MAMVISYSSHVPGGYGRWVEKSNTNSRHCDGHSSSCILFIVQLGLAIPEDWGDGLVNKVLKVQSMRIRVLRVPEPQNLHRMPGVVVWACNPRTGKGRTGRSLGLTGQAVQPSLEPKVPERPCLKKQGGQTLRTTLEVGLCPLCTHTWAPASLREHVTMLYKYQRDSGRKEERKQSKEEGRREESRLASLLGLKEEHRQTMALGGTLNNVTYKKCKVCRSRLTIKPV